MAYKGFEPSIIWQTTSILLKLPIQFDVTVTFSVEIFSVFSTHITITAIDEQFIQHFQNDIITGRLAMRQYIEQSRSRILYVFQDVLSYPSQLIRTHQRLLHLRFTTYAQVFVTIRPLPDRWRSGSKRMGKVFEKGQFRTSYKHPRLCQLLTKQYESHDSFYVSSIISMNDGIGTCTKTEHAFYF